MENANQSDRSRRQDDSRLDPQTQMGAVALAVADLAQSMDFYRTHIGLSVLYEDGQNEATLNEGRGEAVLGVAQRPLLHLVEQPGIAPVARGRTGLYHYALLLPSRAALGASLRNLMGTRTRMGGASDHGVSEALYLSDPDGHGIEIYRDRPRAEWPFADGQLQMTVDPLDAEGILADGSSHGPWSGLSPETVMGHVHLHVDDLARAEDFYVHGLGFDLMQRFGDQASFVSAGGYHHHLGLNIWAGAGAPPPPEDAARLLWYEIVLPHKAALEGALARLQGAGTPASQDDRGWWVYDPAKNLLRLAVARHSE